MLTEEDVKAMFSEYGPVQSCKIIKDKLTQVSLGYAFINYRDSEDATLAIERLNGLHLQNKTIKVSYARPSSTTIKNANLYVAHLPKTFSQRDLEELFRPYGNIITSRILIDTTTGMSRGVGFVRYDKHAEAELAISRLNGKLLPGVTMPNGIMVKFANQSKPSGLQPLAADTTSNQVAFNNITALTPLTRRGNPGFNPSGAGGPMRHVLAASMRFNPVSVTPQAVSLATLGSMAVGNPNPAGFCIFVYNLPENTSDSLLYQLFSPFGAITSVKVIKDNSTNKCKRYSFVNMMNYDEACGAIASLNGFEIEGRALQVSFKSPKDDPRVR